MFCKFIFFCVKDSKLAACALRKYIYICIILFYFFLTFYTYISIRSSLYPHNTSNCDCQRYLCFYYILLRQRKIFFFFIYISPRIIKIAFFFFIHIQRTSHEVLVFSLWVNWFFDIDFPCVLAIFIYTQKKIFYLTPY